MIVDVRHDRRLRGRVKLLGRLLGEVLRTQEGEAVYRTVEALRRGYVHLRREPHEEARGRRLARIIEGLDLPRATHVVRAFAVYFSLVNTAEEAFRHHERRRMVRTGDRLWRGSFDATLHELRDSGVSATELERLLACLSYVPVFTAHPTEAKRRTVMEAQRRIFVLSEVLDEPGLGPDQKRALTRRLQREIQVLWKTDEVRPTRPTVEDEIRTGLFYYRESLFEAVPTVYRNLERALRRVYPDGQGGSSVRAPTFLRFGSWIGGDRDGNPHVRPQTTALALRLQMLEALGEYERRVERLGHVLTQSARLCRPSPALLQSLERERPALEALLAGSPARFAEEPYRRKLHFMHHRLEQNRRAVQARVAAPSGAAADGGRASRARDSEAYASADDFLGDLYLIRDSLVSHGDALVADGDLADLIRLAETFGFGLAHLDVRQEAARHAEAVAEILEQLRSGTGYRDLPEDARIAVLAAGIERTDPAQLRVTCLSESARETLEVFRTMASMREEIGPRAFGSYVISMTHAASDVLEVLYLAALAGLAGRDARGWFCHLHAAPLFETIDDLGRVENVLGALFGNPVYRALLAAAGGTQEVMLGYSDSCKDGGILASAWGLYEAQKKIAALAAAHGVRYRLFHGRGGTMARGGGPTHDTLLAYPPGTVRGEVKFTEQGEVLYYKYSNRETAVYELTVGMTGLMKASRCLLGPAPRERPEDLTAMDELARLGERAYRDLTESTPGFLDYFYEATPVENIGELNIGSRPSHRTGGTRSLDSIRAIPWVFGWAQARHTLPAWYGIGAAIERWRGGDPARLARLQRMYREWPFFRSLLDNTQMALFKAEMNIAREYTALSRHPQSAQRIYGAIAAEYRRCLTQIFAVTGISALLEEGPALQLSLLRRNPYLDPLNRIQIVLLRRCRDPDLPECEREGWRDPLLRTINAIAAGMRNTG